MWIFVVVCKDISFFDKYQTFFKKIWCNFNKFTDILNKHAGTVYRVLDSSNSEGFRNENSKYSNKLNYYLSESELLQNAFNGISRITQKHEVDVLSDAVNVIVHEYIPALKRFRNSKIYNTSLASSMIVSGNNSVLLGAAIYLKDCPKTTSKAKTKVNIPKMNGTNSIGVLLNVDNKEIVELCKKTSVSPKKDSRGQIYFSIDEVKLLTL